MSHLAVVTGASRGLGRAVVDELADVGWSVVAVVRDGAHPARPWPVGTTPVVADVGSDEVVAAMRSVIGDRPLDLLVNNAAMGAPIVNLDAAEVQSLLDAVNVNVAGPLRMIKGLLPNLLGSPDALILNLSSRLASLSAQSRGEFAHLGSSYAYRVSKAAQNMLTISVANELAGHVRCWAVHPGALLTDMALADASKPPELAAKQLRELVETRCDVSPRFCSLGGGDLAW